MNYTLAIFDMDGTILDTLEDLTDSTNYMLKSYNKPTRSIAEIKTFVGNGIKKLVERAVANNVSEKQLDEMLQTFTDYYKDNCAIKTKPYAKINDTIQKIKKKGIITAVVSNKDDYAVKILCDRYFDGLFDYSVGVKDGIDKKPSADGVNCILKKFGTNRNQAVYIGDSEVDYQTAQNARLDVIMVSWGFRDKEYLKSLGAKIMIDSPEELLDFFRKE